MTKGYSQHVDIGPGHLTLGENTYPFEIRRNPRARRMLLRVMPRDGTVVLVLPKRASSAAGERFVAEQAAWIAARQAERPAPLAWGDGVMVPLNGEPHRIRHRPAARGRGVVWLEDGEIHISGRAEHLPRRLRDWLRRLARESLAVESMRLAARLGVAVRRVTVRDTRSRWGSCTAEGALSFSWRIVMAPPLVQRYLVAHEVAHLAHMNHSAAFWREVTGLLGSDADLRTARLWLRRHGGGLHLQG